MASRTRVAIRLASGSIAEISGDTTPRETIAPGLEAVGGASHRPVERRNCRADRVVNRRGFKNPVCANIRAEQTVGGMHTR